MSKYVTFLRGINVGGHKKVPMHVLKNMFGKLGFLHTKTLLATGNIVFEAESRDLVTTKEKIELNLQQTFGFKIGTTLRYFYELENIVLLEPFKDVQTLPSLQQYATFLNQKSKRLKLPFITPDKSFRILSEDSMILFSIVDTKRASTPSAMTWLEKEYGKDITTRNWNTILKISKL